MTKLSLLCEAVRASFFLAAFSCCVGIWRDRRLLKLEEMWLCARRNPLFEIGERFR